MSLSLESLFATPKVYGATVSPNCKWVAWTWANIEEVSHVYIAPTDGSALPVKYSVGGQDVFVHSWSFDSSSLVVGHDTDGDEFVELYKLELGKPGEMQKLTGPNLGYFVRGGMLSLDNQSLFYAANIDFKTGEVIDPFCVYRHDLKTGEKKLLARQNIAGYTSPELNSVGTHLLYARNDLDPSGRQIWVVDVDGKKDEEVLNFGAAVRVSIAWFPSGDKAVFLVEEGVTRKVGVWHLGSRKTEWVIDDPSFIFDEDVSVPYGSNSIVVYETKNARRLPVLVDPVTKERKHFSGPNSSLLLAQLGDTRWLIKQFSSAQPADLFVFDTKTGKLEMSITKMWEKVSYTAMDLAAAEDIRWQGADGAEIQGWLYRPKTNPKGTIVNVHGGPNGHSEDMFQIDVQYLVSQGFTVLEPNYRGSTGFGLEFQELIKKDGWGANEQMDIILGIKMLIEKGIAEPGKVGMTGTSYGGYSSWHAITHASKELVAAAAPICGMTDLVVDYESTRPDLRRLDEEMMGGSPTELPELYRERSPIHFVKNIEGKLLIVQGSRDPNVTMENVKAVELELKKNNIPYKVLVFDDEGHGINKPKNEKILLERLAQFFGGTFYENSI